MRLANMLEYSSLLQAAVFPESLAEHGHKDDRTRLIRARLLGVPQSNIEISGGTKLSLPAVPDAALRSIRRKEAGHSA
jgi:hypothetical protein